MPPRRTFGHTWWGQAWLDALEGRAVHDPNRLPRGRTYARQGRSADLDISPGRVETDVQGSRDEPYAVTLQVRLFRDDEWEVVVDVLTAKAARAAALLDGELDPDFVAEAAALEVELLPRSGELRTACSCPDWAEPCKHAAAVCYLVADAVDQDPFVLLRLRGWTRDQVLAAVRERRRNAAPAGDEAAEPVESAPPPGVDAAAAWATEPGPLPSVPAAGPEPGRLAPWPSDPPEGAPFTAAGLRALADDAIARAWELRAGGTDPALVPALDLDGAADLARRAAAWPETVASLAVAAGVTAPQLRARAAAWRHGGVDGLRAVDETPWPASTATMVAAREAVLDAGVAAKAVRVRANRLTVGSVQLRYGLDGRWWAFAKHGSAWHLAAPPGDLDDVLSTPIW